MLWGHLVVCCVVYHTCILSWRLQTSGIPLAVAVHAAVPARCGVVLTCQRVLRVGAS